MTKIVRKKKHALLRYKKQMSVYRFDCTINTLLIAFASDRMVLFVFRIFLVLRYDVWIEVGIPPSLSFSISLSTTLNWPTKYNRKIANLLTRFHYFAIRLISSPFACTVHSSQFERVSLFTVQWIDLPIFEIEIGWYNEIVTQTTTTTTTTKQRV